MSTYGHAGRPDMSRIRTSLLRQFICKVEVLRSGQLWVVLHWGKRDRSTWNTLLKGVSQKGSCLATCKDLGRTRFPTPHDSGTDEVTSDPSDLILLRSVITELLKLRYELLKLSQGKERTVFHPGFGRI